MMARPTQSLGNFLEIGHRICHQRVGDNVYTGSNASVSRAEI